MKLVLHLCLLLAIFVVEADDAFNILRDDSAGFARVIPGKNIEFPIDHDAHPSYRIEWWYLTANLTDETGRHWGMQWTLFRQAMSSAAEQAGWSSNQLWMAHAAITSPTGHRFEQRFARGGVGQAGVTLEQGFEAWIDDWVWHSASQSLFPSTLRFQVAGQSVEMMLDSSAEWLLNGDNGYSQKSSQGQASYYYSQPQIEITGRIDQTNLSGNAWLDREWSSQPLAPNQSGWDWFSLHFDHGEKLMLYRLRHDDGKHWLSGSWLDQHGERTHLKSDAIQLSEKQYRQISIADEQSLSLPLDWSIELISLDRQFLVKPLYDQQWMHTRFPYWEGVVLIENHQGESVGKGYMELTGYD